MTNLFILIINYAKPLQKIEEYLKSHREYLSEHYKKGILLASGPQNPKVGGIIIGKFTHKEEALQFSQNDPFYKNNLATYEIIEFEPVLHSNIIDSFLQIS